MLKKLIITIAVTLISLASDAQVTVNSVVTDRLQCADDCENQYAQLRRYARNGSPRAQTLLGLMHKTGEFEREPDPDEAWRWMKRAKLQRYAPAMYYLSEWYREGYRNDVDVERADDYLQRAADRGYVPAIFQLGMRLMESDQHEEGMKMVNVALESKFPLALKFKELLDAEFDKQANSSEAEPVLISVEKNVSSTERQVSSTESDSDNKLVIYGTKEDPQLLMVNLMKDLEGIALFNNRGYTGSRLGDLKCGQGGSFCRNIKFEDGFGYDTFVRGLLGGRGGVF